MSDKWVSSSKFNTQRQKPELKIIGEQFIFQKLKKKKRFSVFHLSSLWYKLQYMCVFSVSSAGYYTHVSTLADVQENVMEYLHVLSRPMVINHDHDIIWTEAYMDSVVSLLVLLLLFNIIIFVKI